MTTIITRKALMPGGLAYHPDRIVPPDLVSIVIDWRGERHVVTWAEVMANRRERQRLRLEWLRSVDEWTACKLRVAYFDQALMGGWHAFLEDRRGDTWIDRDAKWQIPTLLKLFPLGNGDWRAWKVAFAKKYKRRRQDRQPLGVVYLWRCGREPRIVE